MIAKKVNNGGSYLFTNDFAFQLEGPVSTTVSLKDVTKLEYDMLAKYVDRIAVREFMQTSQINDTLTDGYGTLVLRNVGNNIFSVSPRNTPLLNLIKIAIGD